MTNLTIRAALTALLLSACNAFYVPGVKPLSFQEGDMVEMKVNAMTSIHTQIPKEYYKLPFCIPAGGPKMASESLGEFLTGNKIQNSAYSINMKTEAYCVKLCQIQLGKVEAARLKLHIKYGYHNNWIIDNLPSAAVGLSVDGTKQKHYAGGFPIGFYDKETTDAFVYNHVNIILDYHQPDPTVPGYRVVGFSVEPVSVNHQFQGGYVWDGVATEGYSKPLTTCSSSTHSVVQNKVQNFQIVKPDEKILYTYDVTWQSSDTPWASRWDVYLSEDHLVPAQVHWYSITNSILVALFLSFLVITILVRNLRRDIAGYNAIAALTDEETDEDVDETGWKLVHADVFRPPSEYPMLYCVFVGTGVQLGLTTLLAIIFSAVGFLSPARRGSLMTATLVFYMLCGSVAGYCSSRLYKAFRGRQWQTCTVCTATLFPGVAFSMFLFFNIILAFKKSSGSVPFLDVLIVAAMWCCVAIPMVFLGAYFGYKADTITFPTVTSTIARAIPEPPFILNPKLHMVTTGIVPFAAAYVELFFIMTSMWMDQFYYVFGFTLIVFLILLITCAEVTVLLVYYQLCAENHRWWWFAFITSGSTAFYTFVYSFFWFRTLEASRMLLTYLLYFGYMFLVSFAIFLVTGTMGALTSLWFVRKIFCTIKVD